MYKKTTLDNGIRVLTDESPSRTVATGIWITAGARDEAGTEAGCAHFCEHMMFKGTPTRTAKDIARELDRLGGASNAFTSKETTCLHGTVLDEQLADFFALSADLFLRSTFPEAEVRREAGVILQEIGMVEDSPEELIHDLFAATAWSGHPLANPVLGAPRSVGAMTRERLRGFVSRHYRPDNLVIAAAGHVKHEDFIRLVERHLPAAELPPPGAPEKGASPLFRPGRIRLAVKDTEQSHVLLGVQGPAATDSERYAAILLNIILGGNMSSRLFQEIREKRGLAYSIYSFADFYRDAGAMGVYAAVAPENVPPLLDVVKGILDDLAANGVGPTELARAREAARASMYLAAEGMEAKVNRLAANEMLFGRDISLAESEKRLAETGVDDVAQTAARLAAPVSGVVLGPETADFSLPFDGCEIMEEEHGT